MPLLSIGFQDEPKHLQNNISHRHSHDDHGHSHNAVEEVGHGHSHDSHAHSHGGGHEPTQNASQKQIMHGNLRLLSYYWLHDFAEILKAFS